MSTDIPAEAVQVLETAVAAAAVSAAVTRMLDTLVSEKTISAGSVESVRLFAQLPEELRHRVRDARLMMREMGWYEQKVSLTPWPDELLPEVAEWVHEKVWSLDPDTACALRQELLAELGEPFDWEEYWHRVEVHPDAYRVWRDPGDPHDRVLVTTCIVPAMPLNSITLTINLGEADDSDEDRS
jgi:hypothetical protein